MLKAKSVDERDKWVECLMRAKAVVDMRGPKSSSFVLKKQVSSIRRGEPLMRS